MNRPLLQGSGETARAVDAVTLEIVKNALECLADEMALVILRSAYSPIVRDSMDYSTAVCDRNGEVIAQGLTNPIHLGSFPRMMRHLLDRFEGQIRPGDGFLVNDPYEAGGMHLPDVYFVRPVFLDGRIEGFTSALVHHTDLGGMAAGSMALNATELFQEGLRIPLVKLYDAGVANEAVFAFLRSNTRMPEEVMGDLRAQISACNTAERGLQALVRKYGSATFNAIVRELHDYAERLVRKRLAAMPDGVYEALDHIDGLGESGARIDFKVRITIAGEAVTIDWDGTSPQVPGAINGPITTTYSLAYASLRAALGPGIPNCQGYMRPITVKAPLGTIVNPRPHAACAARGIIAYRMLDTCFAAFAQVIPESTPAGGEGGPTAISFSGIRKDSGEPWLITDGLLGSWGARHAKDGVEGISSPGANLSNQPVELIEARLPLRIEEYGFERNSGGAGARRGGLAIRRSYRILDDGTVMTLRSDRRKHLPLALEGGMPGSPSYNIVKHEGAADRILPVMPMGPVPLAADDLFIHIAAGGAGRGDPLERDPARVLADIRDDKVSAAFARQVYGVVVADGAVDETATAALRIEMKRRSLDDRQAERAALFLHDIGIAGEPDARP